MDSDDSIAVKYGFQRPGMYKIPLANTVCEYDRHVFLFYKSYEACPTFVDDFDTDLLRKRLLSAIQARTDVKVKIILTICGGCDGITFSDGDVLIFPEMVMYRGLKNSNVERFVDDVVVNGKSWETVVKKPLSGAFVFVCAPKKRDERCGFCGPILIDNFKAEIQSRDLTDQISVSPCLFIPGHQYAGHLIIFRRNSKGKVTGDWFGYVTPNDVPDLIERYIGEGVINEKLWRGQMGLYEEDVKVDEKEQSEVGDATRVRRTILMSAGVVGAVAFVAYSYYRRSR